MVCYSPIKAYWSRRKNKNTRNYYPVFNPREGFTDKPLLLPCGKCEGCRRARAFEWSIRCQHESFYHKESYFLTLTYDKEHLPADRQLNRLDLQLFIKRLRKQFSGYKLRVFYCGEYGGKRHRPHYHLIVFGLPLKELGYKLYLHDISKKGNFNYVNPVISARWSKGLCTIGSFSPQSAAYVARYTTKKLSEQEQTSLSGKGISFVRPFIGMSNRPSIGQAFCDEFRNFICRTRKVIYGLSSSSGGTPLFVSVPRYYRRYIEKHYPVLFYKAFVLARRREQGSRLSKAGGLPYSGSVLSNSFVEAFAQRLSNLQIKISRIERQLKLDKRLDL